jgi:hypothetical protein
MARSSSRADGRVPTDRRRGPLGTEPHSALHAVSVRAPTAQAPPLIWVRPGRQRRMVVPHRDPRWRLPSQPRPPWRKWLDAIAHYPRQLAEAERPRTWRPSESGCDGSGSLLLAAIQVVRSLGRDEESAEKRYAVAKAEIDQLFAEAERALTNRAVADYSSARIDEIAGLRREGVREVDGVCASTFATTKGDG